MKLSETSTQLKNLEKGNYFSRADASESEINGEESDRGNFSQREVSQIQNDLLFGDMGQGKLLSKVTISKIVMLLDHAMHRNHVCQIKQDSLVENPYDFKILGLTK